MYGSCQNLRIILRQGEKTGSTPEEYSGSTFDTDRHVIIIIMIIYYYQETAYIKMCDLAEYYIHL